MRPRFDRRQRIDDEVADGRVLLELLRALQVDLLEVVLDLLDHFDHAPQAQVAGLAVELGANVVLGAVAGAGGALDRVFHRLDDDAAVDQLLAGDRVGDCEQLGLVGGSDGRGGSGHVLVLYSLDCVGALGAERRGCVDELVGQQELGRMNGCEGNDIVVSVLAGDMD